MQLRFINEGDLPSGLAVLSAECECAVKVERFIPPYPKSSRFPTAFREYFRYLLRLAEELRLTKFATHLPARRALCGYGEYLSLVDVLSVLSESSIEIYILLSDDERRIFAEQLFDIKHFLFAPVSPIFNPKSAPACPDGDIVSEPSDDIVSAPVSNPASEPVSDISSLLRPNFDGIAATLRRLIDARKITDIECCKAANISREIWQKIVNDGDYLPSKNTLLSFAVALRLTVEQTKMLLETVGFTLSPGSKFDVVVGYYISKGVYDLFLINAVLYSLGLGALGA